MTASDSSSAPRRPEATTAELPSVQPQTDPTAAPALAAHSMARSASIVAIAFVASRLLGLVREVILARQFGTSGEYDAYVSAFRIPDLLFLVVMAGSFGSAFIPVFAGYLGRNDQERAWALASAVINLAAVAIFAAAAIAFALAGPIIRYLVAPGLSPDNTEIAVNSMRILLLSPMLLGMGIAAKGILESHRRFELPALAPVVYNLAIILGAIILAPTMGVYGVAVGVVVGALGHVLVQVPGLLRVRMRFRFGLNLNVDGLSEVGRLLLPRVVGQAAFQINFIVVNYFASNAGEQRVSAMNYAWQLLMLPHGVLALSISTVVFPTMAVLYQQGRTDELQATLARALRPLLFLTLPASVGLFAFRTPIIQSIFQIGEFSARSTSLVAAPLALFAVGLTGYAVVEILTRAFYAMHDTRTPVASGILIIILNVILCAMFVEQLGHTGLALSLSATTAAEAVILVLVLRQRTGGIDPGFGPWFVRVAAATAITATVALLIAGPLVDATTPGDAPRLFQLALLGYAIVTVAAVYATAAYYLRVPELALILNRITSRLPAGSLDRVVRLIRR